MDNIPSAEEADETALIEIVEEEGWDHYPDPPTWVVSEARQDDIHEGTGFEPKKDTYRGRNYIYLAVSYVHSRHVHIFSMPKDEYENSELPQKYRETDSESGTCPNCLEYVRRYSDDKYLTCNRCGWQYKPLSERVRAFLFLR